MTDKKFLDHDTIKESWEVNSDIRLDVTSCLHWKKGHNLNKSKPDHYIIIHNGRKFPQPKPIFTFEVKH